MKTITVLFLFFLPFVTISQNEIKKNSFNHVVSIAKGDLNKDGMIDSAVVSQDTIHHLAPYRLEIFFTDSNGKKTLFLQTDKAIEAQYPYGKEQHIYGNGFDKISIHKGVLWIETGLIRGHFEHKFRFQNDTFELIGYTKGNSDGQGKLYLIDFNLMTGKRIEKIEYYSSNKASEIIEKTVKLKPLPKLKDFEQYSNELF